MPTTLLGIDIGKHAVKVAALQTSYRKIAITGLGMVNIVDVGGDVSLAIRQAVEVAITKPGLAGSMNNKPTVPDAMAVALDGERAALRIIELPASAERQLGEVLPFELEAQMPFEIDDAVFDYRVLPRKKPENKADGSPGDAAVMMDVLTAVAKTTDVQARIDLIKNALATEPEQVGVGALPLANLAETTEALRDVGPVVVVDLGADTSDVLILESGAAKMARTISFGLAGLPDSAPKIAREIRMTLAAYRSTGGRAPAQIFLSGEGSLDKWGAAAFLRGELELPVSNLPPPTMEIEGDPQRLYEAPFFARALGLALGLTGRSTGLNLRRGPLAYERGFGWIREKIPVVAGLTLVIAVSFIFSSCVGLYATAKDLDTLHEALGLVTKDVLGEETTDAAKATDLLSQKAGTPDEDPMPHADAFDVMVRLSEDIPQSMVHDIEELDVQKGHVIVHGIVGSIPDAQSIAGSLKTEKCFQDVKVTRTNQMVGSDRQKYSLEFDLKCPEDSHGDKKKKAKAASSASAAPSDSGGK
ncbi:MAG: pilus assembly protein PilM [Polyangiaceae bacterium]